VQRQAGNAGAGILINDDIAQALRTTVGTLETSIKKLKSRANQLKKMFFELAEHMTGPAA